MGELQLCLHQFFTKAKATTFYEVGMIFDPEKRNLELFNWVQR
jgi:hypothetical protein